MSKTVGIYVIWNVATDKVYVGSSIDVRSRFWQHRHKLRLGLHRNKYLQSAWNKYGEQAFIFEIIHRCSPDERFSLETWYITKLNSHHREFGFNTAYPARQMLPSPAMSEIAQKSWRDPQTGHNRRMGIQIKWADKKFREAKAKDFEKGQKAAQSRWSDPNFRAQQSAIRSAKWDNPNWRASREAELRIKSIKGHTPKAKAKRKVSLKAMWADPEFKAKHIARLRRNAIAMTQKRMAKRAAEKQSNNEIV